MRWLYAPSTRVWWRGSEFMFPVTPCAGVVRRRDHALGWRESSDSLHWLAVSVERVVQPGRPDQAHPSAGQVGEGVVAGDLWMWEWERGLLQVVFGYGSGSPGIGGQIAGQSYGGAGHTPPAPAVIPSSACCARRKNAPASSAACARPNTSGMVQSPWPGGASAGMTLGHS